MDHWHETAAGSNLKGVQVCYVLEQRSIEQVSTKVKPILVLRSIKLLVSVVNSGIFKVSNSIEKCEIVDFLRRVAVG